MIGILSFTRETVEVNCDIDIEQTPESFHAHAIPDGVQIRAGDEVVVHDAPARIAFGERLAYRCTATVKRAGVLKRAWTEFAGVFALTELYDVGFEPKEAP